MKDIKGWQIAVMVAAVLAMGWTVFSLFSSDTPKLRSSILLVDLSTGALYEAKLGGKISAIIPEKNPDTGTYSLYPVSKDESGVWKVSPRYLGGELKDRKSEALVSLESGEVRVSSDSVKTIKLGK
jgi:hypothetical protein